MCGAFSGSSGLARSDPWAARASATKRRFSSGKPRPGRALKRAWQERRSVVLLDESGLSQRTHRARTWAPRGQTPILTFNTDWKNISTIAGLNLHCCYFRLHPGAIKGAQVVEFLDVLHRQLPGNILLLWGGAAINRSKLVTAYLLAHSQWLHVERLPARVPEFNPVEYLSGYRKKHELANFCPKDIWHLNYAAS